MTLIAHYILCRIAFLVQTRTLELYILLPIVCIPFMMPRIFHFSVTKYTKGLYISTYINNIQVIACSTECNTNYLTQNTYCNVKTNIYMVITAKKTVIRIFHKAGKSAEISVLHGCWKGESHADLLHLLGYPVVFPLLPKGCSQNKAI